MQSFRTELENPVVERDILELERKIRLFREGKIDEEKFRSLRLARGVYGQRQQGVQMVRIKLPFGKMTVKQLLRICDVSVKYSTGKLHFTTRQDIQIHYISLDRTPELWAELEQDDVTLREACGNTVRNITASSIAGIDPDEPFDVSPYAFEMFTYFLRNPICQEMGRKFKIAFSSSEKDTALTFMHDLGFIAKTKIEDGKEIRGFKVVLGGGLGAQPYLAEPVYEFLEEDQIMPFSEAVLRVFDRFGERQRRFKARLKFLINDIGLEAFLEHVKNEWPALKNTSYKFNPNILPESGPAALKEAPQVELTDKTKYEAFVKTNVFEQKQKGFFAVQLKVVIGDLSTEKSRKLAALVKDYAADDIRITINQGLLIKFVRPEALPYLFTELDKLGLAEPGFDSTGDITSCPGTDTCNLGISNSTTITQVLEQVIEQEYPEFLFNKDIKIKISGCMNSCGQHGMANIGFHGSSLKAAGKVMPALQVLLGGGVEGDGKGAVSDKVIKVPSKKGPDVLRFVIGDYKNNKINGELFNDYYRRLGKDYFYQLLKPLADLTTIRDSDFIDWGNSELYKTEVGLGECAGVMIDLVATLILEAEEKYDWAQEAFENGFYADSIYHGYNSLVSGAKALLLSNDISCNTQVSIMEAFDKHFVETGKIKIEPNFTEFTLRLNKNEPKKDFAERYLHDAKTFMKTIRQFREADFNQPAKAVVNE